MNESIGQLLKQARLEKNLTIKDAVEETNIITRHITALEDDNYDVFPGEIYILGFLRSYSNFLGLDPDYIIQLYRGSQMEEQEVPIKQLTEPTVTPIDYLKKLIIPLSITFGILLLGFIGYNLYHPSQIVHNDENSSNIPPDMESYLQSSKKIPDQETDHIKLQSGFATALISSGGGIDFSIQNTEIYLILNELHFKTEPEGLSRAEMFLYPGKIPVSILENETQTLSGSEFISFKVKLMGATPNTIKIQLEEGEETVDTIDPEDVENRIANPSNFIIVFEGIATGDNFVEFFVDGKPRKKGLLKAGSHIYYEANDSIQLKIGDAGAMKIQINGKAYHFGSRGQQINKVIRKVKDPLEQTRFQIAIKDS
jgi:transcriptional regulator with XRE-family HTH domain